MSSKSIYTKNPKLPTRLEYFYLIQHKASGKFYAGSKYAITQYVHPDQFWNSDHKFPYYTKSKLVEKIRIEEGPDAFTVCFISPRPNHDAREFEAKFLNSINAASNFDWLNQSNGSNNFKCESHAHSDETKAKIGLASAGRICSDITRAKMSEARLGVSKSDETKLRMSESFKGRIFSDEHRNNISLSQRGKIQETLTCVHCNKEGGKSNMKRYHFDNCKSNKRTRRSF